MGRRWADLLKRRRCPKPPLSSSSSEETAATGSSAGCGGLLECRRRAAPRRLQRKPDFDLPGPQMYWTLCMSGRVSGRRENRDRRLRDPGPPSAGGRWPPAAVTPRGRRATRSTGRPPGTGTMSRNAKQRSAAGRNTLRCPRCRSPNTVALDDLSAGGYRKCIVCGHHWSPQSAAHRGPDPKGTTERTPEPPL